MPRYLWHLDPDGWPTERIDTHTGEHVPVFTGGPDESLHPQVGGRPIACGYPRVAGVIWPSRAAGALRIGTSIPDWPASPWAPSGRFSPWRAAERPTR